MSQSSISRVTLERKLQRTAAMKSLLVLGISFAVILVLGSMAEILQAVVGEGIVVVLFLFAFLGLPFALDLIVRGTLCRQRVLCPHCGRCLWDLATRNFKPRKVRVRTDATCCPRCLTPIQ